MALFYACNSYISYSLSLITCLGLLAVHLISLVKHSRKQLSKATYSLAQLNVFINSYFIYTVFLY